MTNDIDIKLIGDKELLMAFNELEHKTQHKRLHQVLTNVGNIPKKAMVRAIPVRRDKNEAVGKKWHPPGTGKKSIAKKRGRSRKSAVLFIGPRVKTGSYMTDAYYLRFWEYYRPGHMRVKRAVESVRLQTQAAIFDSMRVVLNRAWQKYIKR